MDRKREIGDLAPVREVLDWVDAREREDRALFGDTETVRLMAEFRKRLAAALDDAVRPPQEEGMSIEEYAAREGISIWAAYKRHQRGQIAGSRRLPSGNVVISAA